MLLIPQNKIWRIVGHDDYWIKRENERLDMHRHPENFKKQNETPDNLSCFSYMEIESQGK